MNPHSVDRSNTNWTPWPRLAHIPHRVQVVGGVAIIISSAYAMMKWRTHVGGKLPSTITKEWEEATDKLSYAKPTESGADPVVLNPITKSLKDKK